MTVKDLLYKLAPNKFVRLSMIGVIICAFVLFFVFIPLLDVNEIKAYNVLYFIFTPLAILTAIPLTIGIVQTEKANKAAEKIA